jgi:hemolysin activation/secretion protein
LGGEAFTIAPGTVDGKSVVTALRLAFEWADRTPDQVLAARMRFSIGVDALGATTHDSRLSGEEAVEERLPGPDALPDGRFVAWLGQVQWARRLGGWGIETIARLDVQLSTEPLLALEQLAVGGRFSVRGYRENQLVRDNGVIASLEARLPLIRNRPWADMVQLAPFVDVGSAWNTRPLTSVPTTIYSVGVGLRWALTFTSPVPWRSELEVYWGYPLQDVDTPGGDLQDLGLHFQLVVAAF